MRFEFFKEHRHGTASRLTTETSGTHNHTVRKFLFLRFLGMARRALGSTFHVYWYDPTKAPGFQVKQPDGTVTTQGGPSACPLCNSHQQIA